MYIFTVVTVIFAPVSFLAVLASIPAEHHSLYWLILLTDVLGAPIPEQPRGRRAETGYTRRLHHLFRSRSHPYLRCIPGLRLVRPRRQDAQREARLE